MSIRLDTINGTSDGYRWGRGSRPTTYGNYVAFRWSYDLLSDSFRLWREVSEVSRTAEYVNPAISTEARRLVRERLGIA